MDSTWTLYEARDLGVELELDGDLIMAGPTDNITPELREAITRNKPMLVKDLLMRDAHDFLEGHYVEGADLSELDGWHEVIGHAYLESDPDVFKVAVRGYTRAGLRAFAQAKNGVAA